MASEQPRSPRGRKGEETRERILHAAIHGMERDGVAALTVRRIAADAGVNVASISYYFGSKEALLDEVRRRALSQLVPQALDELRNAIAATGSIRAGTAAFLGFFIPQAISWPRVSHAMLQEVLEQQRYDGHPVSVLREFLSGFLEQVEAAMPHRERSARAAAVAVAWSAIFYLGILPRIHDPLAPREAIVSALGAETDRILFGAAQPPLTPGPTSS